MWFYHHTFVTSSVLRYHMLRFARKNIDERAGKSQQENLLARLCEVLFLTLLLAFFCSPSSAQQAPTSEKPRPLVLTEAIPTPGVQGRFDHFGFDGKNQLFVSALGNNSVEVIDISGRIRSRSITEIPNPQGVVYAPDVKKLFVASSKGKLRIFDGTNFDLIQEIDFHCDVDNLRYDPAEHRVYVGYGEDETGAIAMVDATTNERLPEEYKLGAHPESFQLESAGPHIYVNLPDLKQIAVVDRKTRAITRWSMTLEHNFPMALDEEHHRLFVATHEPARLAVFDTNSGRQLAALPCVQDADDVYYDSSRKRIYVPGGEGYISVFQQTDPDHYELLAKVPSTLGARTAGYFGKGRKGFDRFFAGVPARADHGAEVWIYTVQD
jgi:DNA-binding beta-propeller fold protein YncE